MAKITKEVSELAKIIWDYHLMHHKLKKADAIFILGGSHIQVANYGAELFKQGWAPVVVISGGLGKYAEKLWGKTEAEAFRDVLVKKGIPRNKIILEKRASNTGENVINTKKLLSKRGIAPKKVIAVHKPHMERRTYATIRKFWPEVEVIVTSPNTPFNKYEIEGRSRVDLVNDLVGNLQRVRVYSKIGFQIKQNIPKEVWSAYERLVELGFRKRLINVCGLKDKVNVLKKILGKSAVLNELLSTHTILRIGGPADIYYEAPTTKAFIKAISEARKLKVPVTVLGQGTNVLISDEGIRGLVLVNRSDKVEIKGKQKSEVNLKKAVIPDYRWESDDKKGTFKYEFKDLDYDETDMPQVRVKMDGGVLMPKAINYLLDKKITGLQWYAGIPGTIGGAIFNNIHGGTHFLSEVIEAVSVIDPDGNRKTLGIEEIGADYDKSRFHETGEIIINATFLLYKGDVKRAKYVRSEWAKRKTIQPRNSPGCAFHNLTQEQKEKLDLPTTSAGYVIEHLLKMTGFKIGDAAISEKHHNFIVNEGDASAKDYLAVMKEIYKRAKNELGIELVPEIFLLGFDDKEIKGFKA